MRFGGGRGIRTLGEFNPSHDFESCALNQTQPSLLAGADDSVKVAKLTSLLLGRKTAFLGNRNLGLRVL